jgi:hypothetical protein
VNSQKFLEEFLHDGPRTSRDIWQAARPLGLSRRTLFRARRELEITVQRVYTEGRRLLQETSHMSAPSLPKPARPPTVDVMRKLGLEPDSWQAAVLETACPRLLLNCCRQAGKSTVVALLGLVETLWTPGHQVILLSRSHRQSKELFRVVIDFYHRLGAPAKHRRTATELELTNLSRIVCLPCEEETIRGYSHVNLLVIDEAARVPDDVYRAVRPMLAVSAGRLICLSTPCGKRGFFYEAWAGDDPDWLRIEVPASRVPRITPAFLEQERRALGQSWYQQEYCCSFEAMEGLVYPDFAHCVVREVPANLPRCVGGIDFGYRNPCAAVWGSLDHDDVLWITGEHYAAGRVMSYHAGPPAAGRGDVVRRPVRGRGARRAGLRQLQGVPGPQRGAAGAGGGGGMPEKFFSWYNPNVHYTRVNRPSVEVEMREPPALPKIIRVRSPGFWGPGY